MHILIVVDEKKMAELLKRGLEEGKHSVSLAFDGRDALKLAQSRRYDAIVLDLKLPGIDGFEVTRHLRESGNKTPILVLTTRDAVPDVVRGLDLGADDFMTKPFPFEEFLTRLRSVSRQRSVPRGTPLQVGDLVLNTATCEATRAGREIALSRTECRLLESLMRSAGQIIPRNALVPLIWESKAGIEKNTLNVFIHLLRNKVDRAHKVKLIKTIRKEGYAIRDPAKSR